MRVLIKMSDVGSEPIKCNIFNYFNELFAESDSEEAYLYQFSPEELEEEVVLGSEDRDTVLKAVQNWNREIRAAFFAALRMSGCIGKDNVLCEQAEFHDGKLYPLACAARELADVWYPYADHTVVEDGCCSVKPSEGLLQDALAHPEEYAILNVYPK